jgi:hypothetical protein
LLHDDVTDATARMEHDVVVITEHPHVVVVVVIHVDRGAQKRMEGVR